jgi:hypothetical protein
MKQLPSDKTTVDIDRFSLKKKSTHDRLAAMLQM